MASFLLFLINALVFFVWNGTSHLNFYGKFISKIFILMPTIQEKNLFTYKKVYKSTNYI